MDTDSTIEDGRAIAPEQKMWSAVVGQALADACNEREGSQARRERDEARSWLLGFGPDFRRVCMMAGLDPDYVRRAAERLRDAGWRRPEGLVKGVRRDTRDGEGTRKGKRRAEVLTGTAAA